MNGMILSVGEILADMIGNKSACGVSYERKAGGAPFNVACAAKRFGAEVGFAGSVGTDLIGDFLKDFAMSRSLDYTGIHSDNRRNTTLAFVEIDDSGERSFCFYRKNTADCYIPEIGDDVLRGASIVHIGSLMLSCDEGLSYAKNLAARAHALGKTVSFDVNYRTDIFTDKESAVARYKQILREADIIKLSEDEVDVFIEKYIESELEQKLVCISLGSAGSMWRFRGKSNRLPSIAVKPVDTTGAGDAFYAGVLTSLYKVPRENWNAELFDRALMFGNVCGALNTLGKGAIDALPSLTDINNALKSLK